MARTTTTNPLRRIASVIALLLALLVSTPALADSADRRAVASGVEWTMVTAPAASDDASTTSGFRAQGVEWTWAGLGVEWTLIAGD